MRTFIKTASAAFLALGLAVVPAISPAVSATGITPVGHWQDADGTTRFKVTFCGNNHEVCAQLVHLAGEARTPENLQYLNQFVLQGAKRSVGYSWKGEANYLGDTVAGTLTLVDTDTMTINGCKGVLCQTFKLSRV
ncbi:hypothetical protein SAMN02983003_3341 [Devosia enhydra]|uniref:DUF2147 domain-containing protein n=1 Tax=Devosia enhydra TaxID=665118 RepID=A0A1K2I1N3_9HYPH|nr:DUF2147 domain-containing protein [Devosia enhydra]SFZ86167.1 hypothetical protein SAMN02983003_3341 [Devosia enhydra]